MTHSLHLRLIVLTGCLLTLSACGGGGGGESSGGSGGQFESAIPAAATTLRAETPEVAALTSSDASTPTPPLPDSPPPPPPPPPAEPPANPHFELGIKQLTVQSGAVAEASHYQVLGDPDGPAGPMDPVVVASSPDPFIAFPLSLHRGAGATYALRACNAGGCGPASAPRMPDLTQSIGYFKASNVSTISRLGDAVALSADGSTLVVGAPGEMGVGPAPDPAAPPEPPWYGLPDTGAVYVFTRQGSGWGLQSYLKASNMSIRVAGRFGASLALSGDGNILAVGAPGESSWPPPAGASASAGITLGGGPGPSSSPPQSQASGAVYLFHRSAGQWQQRAHVKAPGGHTLAELGHSVALSADGQQLAAGAPHQRSSGAVYLLERSGEEWRFTVAEGLGLRDRAAPPAEQGEAFGYSVALSSDGRTVAAGAPGRRAQAGAVFSFTRTGTQWEAAGLALPASGSTANDRFGHSVALSGDGAILGVGAPYESSAAAGAGSPQGQAHRSGAAYLFTRSGGAWQQQAFLKPAQGGSDDQFGTSLALSSSGRLLAVGAPQERSLGTGLDASQERPLATHSAAIGAAYLFEPAGTDWRPSRFVKPTNVQPGMAFGHALALSADGESLAVGAAQENTLLGRILGGAPPASSPQTRWTGAVYLY